ncbi:MAG: hypothetical protein WCY72_00640, partial [Lysobacteraceae bacterium]
MTRTAAFRHLMRSYTALVCCMLAMGASASVQIDPALRFDPAAGPVDVLVHLRHDVAHVERALPQGSGPEGFA